MDEVVHQFKTAAISENETNFENLYKNRGRLGNQEERRRNILETQKGHRNTKLDRFRGILELVEAVEDDTFLTPRNHWNPTIYVSGFTKIPNYCDVLMMSEWMYEKPSDFAENWFVVPCPKGTRMLVVAHKGITKCFNKYGNFRFECRTALPGGNPCQIKSNQSIVVLDCFYEKDTSTMYVLDILAWNSCVMTEGEAAFRHFWMSGQLDQIPELNIITKKNKLIFKVIPKLPCDTESLNKFLSIFPYYNHNMPPVDGLLFYHQKAQYFAGETPLVGWLYPFMINEVLGNDIKVHPGYMLEKPVDYTNYMDYIEKFESKNFRKRQRKIFGHRKMDTEKMTQDIASTSEATNGNTVSSAPVQDTAPTSEATNGNSASSAQVQEDNAVKDAVTEEKTMDTDDNALAQGDNTASSSSNGNAERKEEERSDVLSKGGDDGDSGPKTKSETENMDADTNAGNTMEAMVADIVKEEEK